MSITLDVNDPSKDEELIENCQHFKERAERNRQKALLLRKSKIVSHPYIRRYVANIKSQKNKLYNKTFVLF